MIDVQSIFFVSGGFLTVDPQNLFLGPGGYIAVDLLHLFLFSGGCLTIDLQSHVLAWGISRGRLPESFLTLGEDI